VRWSTIKHLRVDRIGHGTRSFEDPRLLDHLAAARIPLEVCPVSNLRTGVVRSLDEHPIRTFVERGILVTVATDDPWMFETSLASEFRELERRLGLDRAETRRLILAGIEASWLPRSEKEQLTASFVSDPAWSDPASLEAEVVSSRANQSP
jgi:adenosine deaminase